MLQLKEKELIQKTLKEVAAFLSPPQPLNKDFSSEDLELLYSVATSLHHAGDTAQAGEIFHQLALSYPLTQKYWKGIGSCFESENNWEKAAKAWEMATLIEREDPLPYLHLAECCFSMDDAKKGIEALKTAKSLNIKDSKEVTKKIHFLETIWCQEEQRGA